jgi:putative flippase GtrA
MKKIKHLLDKSNFFKFIIFCLVGGTSALIHLIVFNIFFKVFNTILDSQIVIFGASIYYILSFIMGVAISMIFNFSMNRNITFSAKNESIKRQIPKYLITYSLSVGVNFITGIIVLNLLAVENTLNANIAAISGIIAAIPVSYFGSLLWTFKKKDN